MKLGGIQDKNKNN